MARNPITYIQDIFRKNRTMTDLKAPKNAKPTPSDVGDRFVPGFTHSHGYATTKFPFNMQIGKLLKDKELSESIFDNPELAGPIIQELSEKHCILQGVISTYISLADTKATIVAYSKDDDTEINTEATKKAIRAFKELCRPSQTINAGKGLISYRMSEVELMTAIKKMLLVRGDVYPYIDLREDGTVDLRLLDPLDLKVSYYEDEKGNIDPCLIECWQYAKKGHVGLKIQQGLFRASFNKSPFDLVSQSPLLPAIKPILILEKFTEQLMDMVTIAGFPMIEYSVDIEKFLLIVPRGKSQDEINTMLQDSIRAFQEQLKTGNHKTVHIKPDWLVTNVLNENAGILNADLSQIVNLLTQFVEVSMNLPGTALGTGAEGVNTASVETMLTTKSINYLNSVVGNLMQNILEYILKIKYGIDDVFITFKFGEMTIRTDLDSAGMYNVKQTIIANDLKMGLISPEEASIRQTGSLPYDKKTVKSHVGMDVKTLEAKTQIQPGSGPVDRVANPTGTEAPKSATTKKDTKTK